jgi:hypothetical protein
MSRTEASESRPVLVQDIDVKGERLEGQPRVRWKLSTVGECSLSSARLNRAADHQDQKTAQCRSHVPAVAVNPGNVLDVCRTPDGNSGTRCAREVENQFVLAAPKF